MKKILAMLLLAALLLAGCAPQQNASAQDTTGIGLPDSSMTQTQEQILLASMPMVSVSLPTTTEVTKADDGAVVFQYTYQAMSLVVPEQEIADKIIIDYCSRIDSASKAAEDVRQQALTDYGTDGWNGSYLYDTIYTPMRIDQGVLSLYGSTVFVARSSHPTYVCSGANYNMITGDVLTLGSILQGQTSMASLCELVIEYLDTVAKEYSLREGFAQTVRQRFERDASFDEDWYFSRTGLCFFFAPYEIAPYSSGTVIAEIPYGKLLGILDDSFFPPEQDVTSGSMELISVQEADLTQFTRICELTEDAEGEKWLLYPTGSVQNVRVTITERINSAPVTVFATECLQQGDALMIEAASQTLGCMTLSYESDGQSITMDLTADGSM